MRHRSNYNRLGRKASHRKALHNNMVTSLVLDERIETTKPKAREIKRTVEKMITRAKDDTVHNRRIIRKRIGNGYALDKMFTDIAPRFKERPGGYTRMIKLNRRYGDAGEIVILEFVERPEISRGKKNKEKEAAEKG